MKRLYIKPAVEQSVGVHTIGLIATSNPYNFGEGKDTDFEDDDAELVDDEAVEDAAGDDTDLWNLHKGRQFHDRLLP